MDQEAQRAATFTKNTSGMETLKLEEIEQMASIDDLREKTANLLRKNGIEELFPVQ